ncbi:ITA2B protein, partial [Crypturellus undulatus]|nr:ITA2B protein [Crypturellus undulatus]
GARRADVLVGAPLFLARRPDGPRLELGRVYLYLRRGARPYAQPWQTLTGPDAYGRFGSAIASLGDLDQDGHTAHGELPCSRLPARYLSPDVAVGAPFGGDSGSGCVFVFRGQSEGLEWAPSQRLESPFTGPAAFGFALRGASDLDGNGYPGTDTGRSGRPWRPLLVAAVPTPLRCPTDLLVGAFGADKVAVYRGQPVVVVHVRLTLPDGLNPEKKECSVPSSDARVTW